MGECLPFYEEVAQRTLKEYGLGEYTLNFIRHGDTVTFTVVTAENGSFLLRAHVPVSHTMGIHGAETAMVESELLWLEALHRDTELVLPEPIRNQAGELVTDVRADDEAEPINCTLLRWIEGQPYHRDIESETTARNIGGILAILHNHASSWKLPKSFDRPSRNIKYFKSVLKSVEPAVDDGRIALKDYSEFEKSIEILIDLMGGLSFDSQVHGLMHADAHKGNMLYHAGAIRLIDFSFCAFGNFMFDLGVCLSDMKVELHGPCLNGYQSIRALPRDFERLIQAFFVGSMVGTFSFWVPNPQAQSILAEKVPIIVRDYVIPFNEGERFWFHSR